MRKHLLFLLLLFASRLPAMDAPCELYITFSPNDCINCSVGLTQLHTLPEELQKHMVLRRNDRAFFEEFANDNLFLSRVRNLSLDYSDSLYALFQQNGLSTCVLRTGGKPVLSFPLTELLDRRPDIEMLVHRFSPAISDTISMDSVAFSARISISRGGDHVFIYDYYLNKIVTLDKSGMLAGKGSMTIQKPRISKTELMKIAHLDTNDYKGMLPILRAYGKDKVRYEALSWSEDTLHTLLTFYYPKFRGNDTIISMYFYLAGYVNNALVSLRYVNDELLADDYYNFDNAMPFYVKDGVITFSMYITPPAKQGTKLFSEWHDTGDRQLAFDKYNPVELPRYYIDNKKAYENYGAILRDSLYYCTTYPFIYNVQDSVQYDLGRELERVEGAKLFGKDKKKTFFMEDVTGTGTMIEVLYFIDNVPKIAYYDMAKKQILETQTLSLGKELYMPSLVFLSPTVLMVFDATRTKIVLYK